MSFANDGIQGQLEMAVAEKRKRASSKLQLLLSVFF